MIEFTPYSFGLPDPSNLETSLKHLNLAIGHFDGCHIGHLELFKQAEPPLAVLSFYPRPEVLLKNETDARYLFTRNQKVRALKEVGVEAFYEVSFTRELAEMPAELFARDVLKKIFPKIIYAGSDFKFGKGRAGNLATFTQIDNNLIVKSTDLVQDSHQQKIGSGSLRRIIAEQGRMLEVTKNLGRNFLYEGITTPGKKLGRTIGIPTFNVRPNSEQVIPKTGVYTGYLSFESQPLIFLPPGKHLSVLTPCLINIGRNPTVSKTTAIKIEAHSLNLFSKEDFYDEKIGIYFVERIRDEIKFSNLQELKLQIQKDIDRAKSTLL